VVSLFAHAPPPRRGARVDEEAPDVHAGLLLHLAQRERREADQVLDEELAELHLSFRARLAPAAGLQLADERPEIDAAARLLRRLAEDQPVGQPVVAGELVFVPRPREQLQVVVTLDAQSPEASTVVDLDRPADAVRVRLREPYL